MEKRLTDLIALALPYVEDAAELDEHSQSGKREILRLARDMRRAVESDEVKDL